MKLTDEQDKQLKIKYQDKKFDYMLDENELREDIRALENKKDITPDEEEQLQMLLSFRAKNCSYPSFAYFDYWEMFNLFD